jgi:hypothetical protein
VICLLGPSCQRTTASAVATAHLNSCTLAACGRSPPPSPSSLRVSL